MITNLFQILEEYNRGLIGVPKSDLDKTACLQDDAIFDHEDDKICSLAEKLTKNQTGDWSKATVLFNFARDTIAYDFAPKVDSLRDLSASVISGKTAGFCHQKSILLASLLRAIGIPAALTFQTIVDHALLRSRFRDLQNNGTLHFHGLVCAFLEGDWFRIDATLDSALCNARGYQITKITPKQETLLPKTTKNGKQHFTITEEKGYFESYPKLLFDLFLKHADGWALWRKFVKKEDISM